MGPEDYAQLRREEVAVSTSGRWRYPGQTPSPEDYPHRLWAGVVAQFLVIAESNNTVHGLVAIYDENPEIGVAYAAACTFEDRSSSLVMYGAGMTLDWVFANRPLRKVKLETPTTNDDLVTTLVDSGIARREGYFEREAFVSGEWVDIVTCAIWREDWNRERKRFLDT